MSKEKNLCFAQTTVTGSTFVLPGGRELLPTRARAVLPALWVWLLGFALSFLLYSPYLSAPYFSDDFLTYFSLSSSHLFDYFWRHGPTSHAYRPLEYMFLIPIQAHFGFWTVPIHVISIAVHASLCCIVWIAALTLRLRRFEAWLAWGFMLVTQVGAFTVIGNGTMSQAFSTALAFLSCLLLATSLLREQQGGGKALLGYVAASAFCYFAGLYFKETSLGIIVVIASMIGAAALQLGSPRARIRFAAFRLSPYVLLIAVYFAMRIHAGLPMSGGGGYRVGLGPNVFANLVQFGTAALTPVSSVVVALAIQRRDLAVLALVGAGLLLIVVVVLSGLWKSSRTTLSAALAGSALCALFPAVALQHISELYLYGAMPFLAILLAMGFGALRKASATSRVLAVACSGLLLCGSVLADRQKAALMYANGQAAAALLSSLARYANALPTGSEILLIREPVGEPRYSKYVMHGLDVLDIGVRRLGPVLGRPDIKMSIVDPAKAYSYGSNDHRLILKLDRSTLSPLQMTEN